jgi:hypothetical protein
VVETLSQWFLSPNTPSSASLRRHDAESSARAIPCLAGVRWMAPAGAPEVDATDFGGAHDQSCLLRGGEIIGWLWLHEHHKVGFF